MFLRTRRARCEAVLAGLFITVLSRTAAAQSSEERAQAQALFDSALKAVDKGNDAEGCPKFEAAFALYASPSTMIQIARCHERAGRVASAWAAYRRVSTLLSEAGSPERRKALEESSNERAAALEPRLPRLKITFAGAAPSDLAVERDGKPIAVGALGEPIPLDPGAHAVRAHAKGFKLFEASVTARESELTEVTITLEPEPVQPDPPKKTEPQPVPETPPPEKPAPATKGIEPWAFITGAFGLASAGGAAGALVVDLQAIDRLEQNCKTTAAGTSCLPGYDYAADNLLKNVGFGMSLGLGVAAAALLSASIYGLVDGSRPREVTVSFAPIVAEGLAGATLTVTHP